MQELAENADAVTWTRLANGQYSRRQEPHYAGHGALTDTFAPDEELAGHFREVFGPCLLAVYRDLAERRVPNWYGDPTPGVNWSSVRLLLEFAAPGGSRLVEAFNGEYWAYFEKVEPKEPA